MPKAHTIHRWTPIGRAILVAFAIAVVSYGQGDRQGQPDSARRWQTEVRPVLAKRCFGCHGDKTQLGGLNLGVFPDAANAPAQPELWAKVRAKVSTHQMPPSPLPGLSQGETEALIGWIDGQFGDPAKSSIDSAKLEAGPGRVTARRLNRIEFNNTVRDLLGVTVHSADDFPVDNQGYGFDNIGDVLTLSPMLMEKYMSAARSLSRLAVYGEDYERKPGLMAKLMVKSVQDDGHVSGSTLPFSMRGTLDGTVHAPVEADYILQFRIANRRGKGPLIMFHGTEEEKKAQREIARNAAPPAEMDIEIDGRRVMKEMVLGDQSYAYSRGPTEAKVHLTAGDHRIYAYFPDNLNLADPRENLAGDGRRLLAADYVDVVGPFNPASGHPSSYRKIFICDRHDEPCAREIVTSLARRGFRRPPTEAEIRRLLHLVALVRKEGDSFEEGIRVALQSILISPAFLFRIERDPDSGPSTYRISDYELASRLSYFLWSSMPDEELFGCADSTRLSDRTVLEAQVKRMLRDPKAANLTENFAPQWLDLRALDRKKPDARKFPRVDDELLGYMRRETLLFVGEVFEQDRSLLDLIHGKFTYLNGPLARYYGVAGVSGPDFERVPLEGTERAGLLTHASILTLTSYATRTSPVVRGKWVLESLLGSAPPPPPANVPALEEKNLGSDASVRVRLEHHRANPACAACHQQMDPIGFGLENFDAAGGWRTKEGKFDIDASGTLPDGRSFQGVDGLRGILQTQSGLFTRNLTAKMLTFALGRGLETTDQPAVDQINRKLIENGNQLSALVTEIVESEPFQMRKKEEVFHASR